jgi:hypothetical protein
MRWLLKTGGYKALVCLLSKIVNIGVTQLRPMTPLNTKLANLLADEQMKWSAICQSAQPPIKPVLASTNYALIILLLNLGECLAVGNGELKPVKSDETSAPIRGRLTDIRFHLWRIVRGG